ncbi:MAG: MBL fold metallo-hydrolase [Terriglobia bacterium]
MRRALLSICFLLSCLGIARGKALHVYFVDAEGGQATLIVAPSGESLLIDTGWPDFEGRDAKRIVAAARAAGVKRLDYVLVTHYHMDHVGGVPQLAEKIPVGTFIDHGPSVESGEREEALLAAYRPVLAKARHLVVKPGDRIPVAGIEVEVLAAAGHTLSSPLPGAGGPNPLCPEVQPKEEDKSENAQSVGILLTFGKFRMIDLGDLTWNKELELACPANRLGQVDLYMSTHHGSSLSGPAAMVHALHPRVAVMNNGARKGGDASAWQIIHSSPGLEDIWQLHCAVEAGEKNNTSEPFIANLDEQCKGYAVNLIAEADGSFSVTNTRNGFSRRYNPR